MFEQHIVQLYTRLGIASPEDLPVDAIARAVLSGRSVELVRPIAMTVKRSIMNGNQRVEIVSAPADQLPWLKSLGCFTERSNTRIHAHPERYAMSLETK